MNGEPAPFNRAEQLKDILRRAMRNNPGANVRVRTHLAQLFGVDADDDRLLQKRAGQVRKLIGEVARELRQVQDIDHDLYLPWSQRATSMFRVPNLDHTWETERLQVDSNDLVRLEFCIEALKRHFTEDTIDAEKLSHVRSEVESLKADILTAGFEDGLQQALVDALQALLEAIDEYSLRGVRRLEEGLAIAVGTVVIKFGQLQTPGSWEKWSRYTGRVGAVLTSVMTLISGAVKHKDMLLKAGDLVRALLPGDTSAGE